MRSARLSVENRVNPATRQATSFLGSGKSGTSDGNAAESEFHEPGGVSVANGKLYIADTNNHRIRVADLDSRSVETLELKGL